MTTFYERLDVIQCLFILALSNCFMVRPLSLTPSTLWSTGRVTHALQPVALNGRPKRSVSTRAVIYLVAGLASARLRTLHHTATSSMTLTRTTITHGSRPPAAGGATSNVTPHCRLLFLAVLVSGRISQRAESLEITV